MSPVRINSVLRKVSAFHYGIAGMYLWRTLAGRVNGEWVGRRFCGGHQMRRIVSILATLAMLVLAGGAGSTGY
jgi:hypothetical protein